MNIEEIREKVAPLLRSYGASRAGVFGSAARGELKKDSDVDILVEIPRPISLLDFVAIKQKLEETLGRKVDLVEYATLKPSLRDAILKTQTAIL